MPEGTPVVKGLGPRPRPAGPNGELVHQGYPDVVEAWRMRARRDRVFARAGLALAAFASVTIVFVAEVPLVLSLAILALAAVTYPIALLESSGRAAQRPVEIYEDGVVATQKRRILRFRRFVPWPEIATGTARELRKDHFALTLNLLDGGRLQSIPGELSREAVEYINERAGEQIEVVATTSAPGAAPQRGASPP